MSEATMKPLAIIAGKALADYHFGEAHAFGPLRHQAFVDGMTARGLVDKVDWLEPVRAEAGLLGVFHQHDFIEQVRQASKFGVGFLDQGDTPARAGIFEAACTVAGSVNALIERIVAGEYARGFVPVAGLHHAWRDHVSGFCVFNDIAIAIEQLRRRHGIRRILYVDIDAHHGDGVFYNYESDPDVCIVDFHEDGRFLYPGTGDADETGCGPAKGSKLNIPLPKQADDALFAALWGKAEPFMQRFAPEFILFQCGADAMAGDPITHLQLSEQSYRLAASRLKALAGRHCNGRMLALGGGGYNMDNIRKAWPEVVKSLL